MKAMTMTSETLTPWLTITTGTAGKLGRNGGEVGFRILRDAAGQQLAMIVTSNSSSGCWSPDILPWDAIERCLPDDRQAPVPAKAFAQAFVGKSANNGPFATAVLLALGFLARSAEHPNRYWVADRWVEIKAELLAQEAGEPYVPTKTNKEAQGMTHQEIPDGGSADEPPKGRGRRGGKIAVEVDHASTAQ
jgi:hypothetical protein